MLSAERIARTRRRRPCHASAHHSPAEWKSGCDISQAKLCGRTGGVLAQSHKIRWVFAQLRLFLAYKLGYMNCMLLMLCRLWWTWRGSNPRPHDRQQPARFPPLPPILINSITLHNFGALLSLKRRTPFLPNPYRFDTVFAQLGKSRRRG